MDNCQNLAIIRLLPPTWEKQTQCPSPTLVGIFSSGTVDPDIIYEIKCPLFIYSKSTSSLHVWELLAINLSGLDEPKKEE